jgi:hypothetical protein
VLSLTLQVGIVSGRYDANDPASPLQLLLGDVGPMLKAAARQLADKSPLCVTAAVPPQSPLCLVICYD